MAGVKGRSGRRPKSATVPPVDSGLYGGRDPLEFLLDVMQGRIKPTPEQLSAARAAAQYVHVKKGDGGKKEEQADAAAKVAAGNRFAPTPAPRLAARDGKAV